MKKSLTAIVTAAAWITISELVRNELLLKSYWVEHYARLGLKFATLPINGILWTVWSLGLAVLIAKLCQTYSFWETVAYVWLAAFVMMWICLFNLQVLPLGLLLAAVPLSLFEVVIAAAIVRKIQGKPGGN